jgi:hypothetical protein
LFIFWSKYLIIKGINTLHKENKETKLGSKLNFLIQSIFNVLQINYIVKKIDLSMCLTYNIAL